MAKINDYRVSIPSDDAVKSEAVKAILQEAVRAVGAKVMSAEAVDGEILAVADTTAFFNAASVKTFVIQSPRSSKTGKVKP